MQQVKNLVRSCFNLTQPFFMGEYKYKAWGLFCGATIFMLVGVYFSVVINDWSKSFYDAIQQYDQNSLIQLLYKYLIILFFFITAFVIRSYFVYYLKLTWRREMTANFLGDWSQNNSYYGTKVMGKEADNPDQRIASDINQFTSLTSSLFFDLFDAVITLITFIFILWNLSGDLEFNLFNYHIKIPSYITWAIIIFCTISTVIFHKIGFSLKNLYYKQEKKEADFRYSLIRLRENAEQIALYKAEQNEHNFNKLLFRRIIDNEKLIIDKLVQLTASINFYKNLSNFLPIIIALPRYFSKKITFGVLMQINNAASQVSGSLSIIIDRYTSFAHLFTVIERLTEHQDTIKIWQQAYNNKQVKFTASNQLQLKNLTIKLPNNQNILNNLNFTFEAGQNYMIKADSGVGKTTLFRTIAGLWPFASGEISTNNNLFFVPQRSYMPQGSLRDIMLYPNNLNEVSNDYLIELLKKFKLDHFIDKINSHEEWQRILSGGEQQKIAFIRAILSNADIFLLDEAVSNLDKKNSHLCYELLIEHKPAAQLISISHNDFIAKYHHNEYNLVNLK